jgi:hypothetical protein
MRLNKRASRGDPRQNMFNLNKRGQFFILSAVIIAAIIVSITSVQNYIGTADAPKKFYYYSQQLEDETGAVVDYALYSDPTGGNMEVKSNLNNFLQQGITKTLQAYPDMELFACYSNTTTAGSDWLTCQNNGTKMIYVNVSMEPPTPIYGSKNPYVCPSGMSQYLCNLAKSQRQSISSFTIAGKNILTIRPDGSLSAYNIPLGNSSVQRGQFYFIARLNTTGGEYVSASNEPKQLSQ